MEQTLFTDKEVHNVWLSHITNKKTSKQYILDINLFQLIKRVPTLSISLKKYGQILSAITKIYYRQINYLWDDLNSILTISTKKRNKPIPKNITLSLQKLMLTDNMIHPAIQLLDTTYGYLDNIEGIEDTLDLSIENVRAEDTLSFHNEIDISFSEGNNLIESRVAESDISQIKIHSRGEKRIKLDDKKIEYTEEEYKKMIRNKKDILLNALKEMRTEIIPEFMKILVDKKIEVREIEIPRDNTMIEIPFEHDISFEPISYNEEIEDKSEIFIEDNFNFNRIVENEDRLRKATMFILLLKQTTDGVINVEQHKPFSDILCNKIIKSYNSIN